MNDITGIITLGSNFIYIAALAAIITLIIKKRWGEIIICIILVGFIAFMINTPSHMVEIGEKIWDLSWNFIEGGQETNVFKK